MSHPEHLLVTISVMFSAYPCYCKAGKDYSPAMHEAQAQWVVGSAW